MKVSKFTDTVVSSAIVMAGCCIGFNACKKDNPPVKDELITYVLKNLVTPSITVPTNEGDSVLGNVGLHTRQSPTCFPVILAAPAPADMEITASVDDDPRLAKVFDSIYKAASPLLQAGMFTTTGNNKVTIKAGQTQSNDSIKVILKDVSGLKQPGTFIFTIPVRLKTSSSNAGLKSSLVFIQYKVLVTDLKVSLSDVYYYNVSIFKDRPQIPIDLRLSLYQPINRDIQVPLELVTDKAFIDAYNLEHNTAYEPFPEGAFECPKTVNIPAGDSSSGFQCWLSDSSKIDPYHDYMLLLKMKDSARAYETYSGIYITAPKSRIDASNSISRTGWTISGSGIRSASNLLDGSMLTEWISDPNEEGIITLDMGQVQTVRGFSFTPSYVQKTKWDARAIEISSSNDGSSWKTACLYLGLPTSSYSSRQFPDIKTAWFRQPVSARYFRFNITASTDPRYKVISELNALK